MSIVKNPLVVGADNSLRPFTAGIKAKEESIATIILLTYDKPSDNADETVDEISVNYLSGLREVVGIQEIDGVIKSDATIAKFKLDGRNDYYGVFNNFSLMSVNESKAEMVKVHNNFGGSWNAFFFGHKPDIYSFNGIFLDTEDYPFYQEFSVAYDRYIRGRKSVENALQMLISYDGKIIEGYLLNLNVDSNAANPHTKTFSFTALVKEENWYRNNILFNQLNPDKPASRDLNVLANANRFTRFRKESLLAESTQSDLIDAIE